MSGATRGGRRGVVRAAVVAAVVAAAGAASTPAGAEPRTLVVTEIAGGRAYLDGGRAAGVTPGTAVVFGGVTLVVVDTTERTCVVDLGPADLALGARGIAEVNAAGAVAATVRPAPRPAGSFVAKWPDVVVPATTQTPRAVRLGAGRAPGRAQVLVLGQAFGAVDRDGAKAQAEARVIASYALTTEQPLAADLDASARLFSAGADGQARVPLIVRTAQLRYGGSADGGDPRLALGRLRYAAASVGMLDGVRASARLGRVEVTGFGGLVPDPLSARPSTAASRFGAEVGYEDGASAWQPRASVTAYGSTWDGALDERRLTASVSAHRAAVFVDGWAEAQGFAADNPWGASAVELTAAGATAQWRRAGTHVGADLTMLRPERSLRLAAALPPSWLCTRAPQPGDVPDEGCTGGDRWTSASLSAGTRGARWSVDAIGAVGRTSGVTTALDSSGYVAGELRFGPRRLLAGVSAGQSRFARWTAGHVGVGLGLGRGRDLAVRYRPELLDYVAATGPTLQHAVAIDAHAALARTLDVTLSTVATTGADRDAVAVLTTLAWRPTP